MRICFSRNPPQLAPLFLGGQEVPIVTTTKYLGFHLDLSGNTQVEQSVKKASKRLHYLTVLARHGLPCEDLVTIYTTLVRPCLEYGGVLSNKRQAALLEREDGGTGALTLRVVVECSLRSKTRMNIELGKM
ncbi:hypothetical protein SKAU_G00359400 [Synaphobranchus kaupii]|uniref:Uncharacterized protein n=1 Tax=Synaphobranchus kaupii TaxID=118154 RepID=A0A9Q1EHY4_SYNKA|nr:hypothetical protein SKAU_G00359400 [Synaphobranchus kaupii]